ncbi:MAG TPA: hypothetical protein DIT04_06705 [Dysgonomonas sp.]|nr:hypothetical protein [Dysgonomonas sp.]
MKFLFKNFLNLFRLFKTSVFLNILGLSVSFAVFLVIAIQTYRDATFNKGFSKIDTIEYLELTYADGNKVQHMSYPLAEQIDSIIPEVRKFCIYGDWGNRAFNKSPEDRTRYDLPLMFTSRGFFDVFTPEIIAGSTERLFVDNSLVLISEKTAKKIFGDEDPVGKPLYNHYNTDNFMTIAAVYKDFPQNSSINNGIFAMEYSRDPSEWSYRLFFDIVPGTSSLINEKLNKEDDWNKNILRWSDENDDNKRVLSMLPLKDMYMDTPGNKSSFLSLLAIGIVMLIIAYINYLNFSVAMAPSRVKTINIHKILGIKGSFLRFSIQMEGVFLAFIAFLLALFYVYIFNTLPISSYFSADLSLSNNWGIIILIGIVLLIIINLVSIYPSQYLSSFKEAMALNGSFALSPRGVKLRNVLIVIQFMAAIYLICVAWFIKIQHDYMQSFNWGIEKENIIYVPINGLNTNFKTFGEEAVKDPMVLDYTASRFVPGNVQMGWGRDFEGVNINIKAWPVLPNFLDFFGAKITAGEGFRESSSDSTSTDQVILNEKFLEKYGFDYNIVGKDFSTFRKGKINGIAGNVNFESVRYPIQPMAFVYFYDNRQIEHIFFKISGENPAAAIESIRKVWDGFSNDEFRFKFLDEDIDKLYVDESNMAKLITLFGIITIIISIMGIYGLIIFNTRYKTKEIAVRKVNGATEMEVMFLLNKNLLILLAVSFILAVPLSYYTITKWVENFAYKASIPWWLFAAAGVLVFIISVITISWQSWKAATANPVESLKNE